jgi:hypothetical protein
MHRQNILIVLIISCYILTSCNTYPSSNSSSWQYFAGRDNDPSLERPLFYRAQVPSHWIRQDPLAADSIADTTKSICEFFIREQEKFIRLTIHTFPILQENMRITPQAQVARWKGQFEELDLVATHTLPGAHGGFSGLFFEGEGILQGNPTKVMGWSMQLASIYQQQLNQGKQVLDNRKRADYTIKASGPIHLVDKYRQELIAFANSFELIDELPSPP